MDQIKGNCVRKEVVSESINQDEEGRFKVVNVASRFRRMKAIIYIIPSSARTFSLKVILTSN